MLVPGAVWPLSPGSGRASRAVTVAGSSSASWSLAWEVGCAGRRLDPRWWQRWRGRRVAVLVGTR